MKSVKFQCPFCNKHATEGYTLKDKDGVNVGVYCSKTCASEDAWGPRFTSFSTRKASSADIAACAV